MIAANARMADEQNERTKQKKRASVIAANARMTDEQNERTKQKKRASMIAHRGFTVPTQCS
jgi:hypothetical protein